MGKERAYFALEAVRGLADEELDGLNVAEVLSAARAGAALLEEIIAMRGRSTPTVILPNGIRGTLDRLRSVTQVGRVPARPARCEVYRRFTGIYEADRAARADQNGVDLIYRVPIRGAAGNLHLVLPPRFELEISHTEHVLATGFEHYNTPIEITLEFLRMKE